MIEYTRAEDLTKEQEIRVETNWWIVVDISVSTIMDDMIDVTLIKQVEGYRSPIRSNQMYVHGKMMCHKDYEFETLKKEK